MEQHDNYLIGKSKVEITFFREGCGMLGYGRHFHYIKGIETPQYVRTFVFKKGVSQIAIVCAEFCFVTDYLKLGIVAQLQTEAPDLNWQDDNIMILAQHTHSAAGGFGQYPIYNMSVPGFQEDVYETYKNGIVKSIIEASENLQLGKLSFHKGAFDKDAEICFNRSLLAYNQNPEVKEKLNDNMRHLAADRFMSLLRIDAVNTGLPLGLLNWFSVHTTSVSNDYNKVCYDNKGYAAEYLEKDLQSTYAQSNIFTVFAQGATGDISPNFRWHKSKGIYKGKFDDDYESAAYNGKLQYEKAKEIFEESSTKGENISGEIDYIQAYIPISNLEVDRKYAYGMEGKFSVAPTMGLAFMRGTTDGIGIPKALNFILKNALSPFQKRKLKKAQKNPILYQDELKYWESQMPKICTVNLSEGSVVGFKNAKSIPLPAFVDPMIKYMKLMKAKDGSAVQKPWGPEIVPIQIFIIGQLAFVGVPSEITTIAGKRLENSILSILKERGIERVIISPYANAYAGYITTPEEYKVQCYEGGHTLYGQWTLPAYQSAYEKIAIELLKNKNERQPYGLPPYQLAMEKLWYRFEDPSIQVL